jgi:hypothetical protein
MGLTLRWSREAKHCEEPKDCIREISLSWSYVVWKPGRWRDDAVQYPAPCEQAKTDLRKFGVQITDLRKIANAGLLSRAGNQSGISIHKDAAQLQFRKSLLRHLLRALLAPACDRRPQKQE